jgi:hypothetical protein
VRWIAAAAALGTAVLIALHWDEVLEASSAITDEPLPRAACVFVLRGRAR